MLPDCPTLKREVSQRLTALFRQMVNQYLGVVGEAPRSVIHEGRRTAMIRESGEVDETPLFQATAGWEIKAAEVPTMTVDGLLERMRNAAKDMAAQISKGSFQSISDAVDKIGNVVDGKGAPFSADLFLNAIEKIQIDFGPDGKPRLPTLVVGPSQGPDIQRALESFEKDPEQLAKFDKLIEKKREEWLAREASRKLVG
jgi:hypothetical protein